MKMKSEKFIFIHIGPHKTGTTSIQWGLCINQNTLKKAGCLVPRAGRLGPRSGGHHLLGQQLLAANDPAAVPKAWADLLDEIALCAEDQNIILSAESFSLLDKARIRTLSRILDGFQVRIIIYLRRQDKLLQSLWAQRIKRPVIDFHQTFTDYIRIKDFSLGSMTSIEPGNYAQLVDNWASVFGFQNLDLRMMEKTSLKRHLFHDFLSACGVEGASALRLPTNRNEIPGAKTLMAMMTLKERLFRFAGGKTMTHLFRCVNWHAEFHKWNQQRLNLVDEETFTDIMAYFEASNQAVARKFFQRDQLFLEPFKESQLTPCSPALLSDADLEGIFMAFPLSLVFTHSQVERILQPNLNQQEGKKFARELAGLWSSIQWKIITRIMKLMMWARSSPQEG